jgi:hypothetical protein
MRAAISLLLAALIPGPALAASPNMKEGMWEISSKMEMAGRPEVAMPQQVVRHCVTKRDIADPRRMIPAADTHCKVVDYKLEGSTATWKTACEGQGSMTGAGSITYSGDSYTGTQTVSMNAGGQAMTMTMNSTGHRVGDCPKQ